jgi:D-beta-D-heptose 7-phosphate kinase/D-beta-D-heptose 1-phosphate adenosyltransferase
LSRAKIKTIAELKKIVARLKSRGKRIIFTNGCFDLLHYGHVKYLEEARKKGDILIVGVNSDSSIKRIKGNKRPLVKQTDRISTLAALESVDYAVIFNEETPLRLIEQLAPDLLVKGSDWDKSNIVGADSVIARGGKVVTVRLLKGRSTTGLIKKIAETF